MMNYTVAIRRRDYYTTTVMMKYTAVRAETMKELRSTHYEYTTTLRVHNDTRVATICRLSI